MGPPQIHLIETVKFISMVVLLFNVEQTDAEGPPYSFKNVLQNNSI